MTRTPTRPAGIICEQDIFIWIPRTPLKKRFSHDQSLRIGLVSSLSPPSFIMKIIIFTFECLCYKMIFMILKIKIKLLKLGIIDEIKKLVEALFSNFICSICLFYLLLHTLAFFAAILTTWIIIHFYFSAQTICVKLMKTCQKSSKWPRISKQTLFDKLNCERRLAIDGWRGYVAFTFAGISLVPG